MQRHNIEYCLNYYISYADSNKNIKNSRINANRAELDSDDISFEEDSTINKFISISNADDELKRKESQEKADLNL